MRIGMVGCGKLGLMVGLTIESCGHEVKGYDISTEPSSYLSNKRIPFHEKHSDVLLRDTHMEMVPLAELCEWADILFLAPQTPHAPAYEGTLPLPDERVDFDYSFLKECVREVDCNLREPKICAVISTVLPGTMQREILPYLSGNFRFVYTPQFIAMGTVYDDYTNPEFWLIGVQEEESAKDLARFYATISDAPPMITDVTTAEGIKVFYNTFITAKTVLANLYGEMAHRCGMNVDDIYKAITLSTHRLLSPLYLKSGMGDGGGCHPRDNIALSWLAREVGLSFDFFEALMTARERHCEFLADLIQQQGRYTVVILGRAFKPETNIETGSPALLLSNILKRRKVAHICLEDHVPHGSGVFFIACKHERYRHYSFPEGSVVIDPFRYMPKQKGVTLLQIGKNNEVVHSDSDAAAPERITGEVASHAGAANLQAF